VIKTDTPLEVKINEETFRMTYSPSTKGGFVTKELTYEIYKCSYLPEGIYKYKLKPFQQLY
jgi:hypothetical protein